jgi:FAD/FMN-containing dehydrogenase
VLIERLKTIVGAKGWTCDERELLPHVTEWRDRYQGKTSMMVSPESASQVSDVVVACRDAGVAIVPQGGNTGLNGGAVPDKSGDQILLSLSRMNRIRHIEPDNFSLIAEAGCVLADVQNAAKNVDRFFPLSLGAEGSCQIGGNLSTNAGGLNVLRYGTAREQALGLEVVLADGTVWDGLRTLRKNTAGYDLKQLFIGSEGTLGIITAASLRLYPIPGHMTTVLLAIDSPHNAVELLAHLRSRLSDQLHRFELIPSRAIRYVRRHIPGIHFPFGESSPWYALLEFSIEPGADEFESTLMRFIEDGIASDAVIAKNDTEAEQLWRIRHSISEAQKLEGASLKHDVSVPLNCVARFIESAELAVLRFMPDARVVAFGHIGDGNVHFNVSQPKESEATTFLQNRDEIEKLVFDEVAKLGGSISAEHGVGIFKREHLSEYIGPIELQLMKTLKSALDPDGVLNPGKVV